MNTRRYYYSTRDLLIMAAMAALGGIASTYINFIGDFFQSALGFAGTTQWAAGLHVLWLVLAVGLTGKAGAGTITGVLKGAVELLTGNTHGLVVVLVDITAGMLVDIGLLPFRRKHRWLAYAFAGGIASASNVFVFQLFAAVPADMIGYGLIGLIAGVAFLSGVVFGGLLGSSLLSALRKAGLAVDQAHPPAGRSRLVALLGSAFLLAAGVFGYLKLSAADAGSVGVLVTGAVDAPYRFQMDTTTLEEQAVQLDRDGAAVTYRGFSLQDIIREAEPDPAFDTVLLTGSDGYTFFISSEELHSAGILLQPGGSGRSTVYNVVGPASRKAWVNGVVEIQLILSEPLLLASSGEEAFLQPADWVSEMDSTRLELESGTGKFQGVPLSLVLDESFQLGGCTEAAAVSRAGSQAVFSMDEIYSDDGIRIFLVFTDGKLSYALAHLDGEVYMENLERIEIR